MPRRVHNNYRNSAYRNDGERHQCRGSHIHLLYQTGTRTVSNTCLYLSVSIAFRGVQRHGGRSLHPITPEYRPLYSCTLQSKDKNHKYTCERTRCLVQRRFFLMMRSSIEGSHARLRTFMFVTLSCHLIFMIDRRCLVMKACSFFTCFLYTVHVSAPFSKVDSMIAR